VRITSPNPQIPASATRLAEALRRIYDRPQPPVPWRDGANLPWDDPAFSERMLAQHLDRATAPPAQLEIRPGAADGDGWICSPAAGCSTSPAAPASRPSSPARAWPCGTTSARLHRSRPELC
jgi:hypothetical protein